MTEQTTPKKKRLLPSKIILVIALVIAVFAAVKFLKTTPALKTDNAAQNHEVIGLSEEYSQENSDADLSDLTVNELREKGAEFIYQNLLKNQIKIDDLYTQIQNLKSELVKYRSQEKIGKMIVVYVDLRDKIFSGKDYNQELKSFEILSASDEVITTKLTKMKTALALYSNKEHLQQNFAEIIPELILNKKQDTGSETLVDKVRRNISRLVIIRRIDGKNPQEVDAVVARIEKLLQQENYQDALSAALSLDQSYHAILKNFLDELSASLEVQQTDQEILNYLKSLS